MIWLKLKWIAFLQFWVLTTFQWLFALFFTSFLGQVFPYFEPSTLLKYSTASHPLDTSHISSPKCYPPIFQPNQEALHFHLDKAHSQSSGFLKLLSHSWFFLELRKLLKQNFYLMKFLINLSWIRFLVKYIMNFISPYYFLGD